MSGPLKNLKHEAFAQAIVSGKTAAQAYKAAGYKGTPKSAETAGPKLFRTVQVRTRVAELTQPAVQKAELTAERLLEEQMRLAYYDLTQILEQVENDKIVMKDPRSLPEDLRRAIVGIKPVAIDGQGLQYECKFADKQKALDSLMRHMQMFKDTIVVENVFRVVKDMPDDELDRRISELERAQREATFVNPAARKGTAPLH